jgi:hypothetical protein
MGKQEAVAASTLAARACYVTEPGCALRIGTGSPVLNVQAFACRAERQRGSAAFPRRAAMVAVKPVTSGNND